MYVCMYVCMHSLYATYTGYYCTAKCSIYILSLTTSEMCGERLNRSKSATITGCNKIGTFRPTTNSMETSGADWPTTEVMGTGGADWSAAEVLGTG